MKIKLDSQQLIDLLPGHVYWKDIDGHICGCNIEQARDLGFNSPGEVIGKTDYDITTKEKADLIRAMDVKVMQNGVGKVEEEVLVREDTTEAIFLSKKEPLRDSKGNIVGILGVSIDITDRKRAEELQAEKEGAEKAYNFATMVAGSIAHELRTPLAVINLQMDLMNEMLLSGKTIVEKENFYKNAIKIVKNKISATTHVISEMLFKIKSYMSGKMDSNFKVTSLVADIEEVLDTYPFEDEQEGWLIKVNYGDRIQYFGDPVFTRSVLVNLIKNSLYAIKEAGKGEITISLKAGRDDDKFNYMIFRDTALGVSKEFTQKIFNQYETKKGAGKGTGLGLAFCKMTMQSYGGDIVCDSEEGKYMEFTLSFPKLR